MKTLLTLLSLSVLISACGDDKQEPIAPPANNAAPTDPTAPPESNPQNVGTDPVTVPGTDPVTMRSFTNSFANNFCDNQASGLDCWGDVIFTETPVIKLYIGRDMICISKHWNNSDPRDRTVVCYAHNAGPYTMNGELISGIQNSDTFAFGAITINTQGQLCFKIEDFNGSTIEAIQNVCGFTPTPSGGIQ